MALICFINYMLMLRISTFLPWNFLILFFLFGIAYKVITFGKLIYCTEKQLIFLFVTKLHLKTWWQLPAVWSENCSIKKNYVLKLFNQLFKIEIILSSDRNATEMSVNYFYFSSDICIADCWILLYQ